MDVLPRCGSCWSASPADQLVRGDASDPGQSPIDATGRQRAESAIKLIEGLPALAACRCTS